MLWDTRSTHASHALHTPTHSILRRAQLPPLHPPRSTSPTARARRPCPGTPPTAPSRRKSAPASTARCVGRGCARGLRGWAWCVRGVKLCAAKRSHRMRMPLEAATCSEVPRHPSHARASDQGGEMLRRVYARAERARRPPCGRTCPPPHTLLPHPAALQGHGDDAPGAGVQAQRGEVEVMVGLGAAGAGHVRVGRCAGRVVIRCLSAASR